MGSDLRTALLAGRFYWQVVMPTSTPGMSPEHCFSCLCNVVVAQEMANVFFFPKFWKVVCLWGFVLFWVFWGELFWCVLCVILAACVLQLYSLQVLGWSLHCAWAVL